MYFSERHWQGIGLEGGWEKKTTMKAGWDRVCGRVEVVDVCEYMWCSCVWAWVCVDSGLRGSEYVELCEYVEVVCRDSVCVLESVCAWLWESLCGERIAFCWESLCVNSVWVGVWECGLMGVGICGCVWVVDVRMCACVDMGVCEGVCMCWGNCVDCVCWLWARMGVGCEYWSIGLCKLWERVSCTGYGCVTSCVWMLWESVWVCVLMGCAGCVWL